MAKKTYYPSKSFDDVLSSLAQLFTDKGWAVVDVNELKNDAQEQRAERSEFDQLQAKYLSARQAFGVAQEKRYQRYAAALFAARGAYRNDKAAMAALAPFKRAYSRRSMSAEVK